MRIVCLQHVDYEGPGAITDWADSCGHQLDCYLLEQQPDLPAPDSFDGLVVLGGPMNIYEEARYPWLADEKRYLQLVIDAGKPILGICLGAQLLAEVLGAPTTQNKVPEIGWFPVTFTEQARQHPLFSGLPPSLHVMHWHSDTFAMPRGAIAIGASRDCATQGFIARDRLVGLQFHLEWDEQTIKALIARNGDVLKLASTSPSIQDPDLMTRADIIGPQMVLLGLLDRLFTGS